MKLKLHRQVPMATALLLALMALMATPFLRSSKIFIRNDIFLNGLDASYTPQV